MRFVGKATTARVPPAISAPPYGLPLSSLYVLIDSVIAISI